MVYIFIITMFLLYKISRCWSTVGFGLTYLRMQLKVKHTLCWSLNLLCLMFALVDIFEEKDAVEPQSIALAWLQ